MGIANVTWEDEENNRKVEISVAYAIENREIRIGEITPKSVAFTCQKRAPLGRTIGVHTPTGRRMLAEEFKKSGQFEILKRQISDQHCALTA
jgi:hypothetical protein